jgi:hypothetical protein
MMDGSTEDPMGMFDPLPTEIQNYASVHFYRKRWFFLVSVLLCVPIGIAIALSGDVYMKKGDRILAYAPAQRIVTAVGIGIIVLYEAVYSLH